MKLFLLFFMLISSSVFALDQIDGDEADEKSVFTCPSANEIKAKVRRVYAWDHQLLDLDNIKIPYASQAGSAPEQEKFYSAGEDYVDMIGVKAYFYPGIWRHTGSCHYTTYNASRGGYYIYKILWIQFSLKNQCVAINNAITAGFECQKNRISGDER